MVEGAQDTPPTRARVATSRGDEVSGRAAAVRAGGQQIEPRIAPGPGQTAGPDGHLPATLPGPAISGAVQPRTKAMEAAVDTTT
jgi:hypothetical protein